MYASGKYDWIGPFFGCMKDDANHVFKVDSIATQLIYILRWRLRGRDHLKNIQTLLFIFEEFMRSHTDGRNDATAVREKNKDIKQKNYRFTGTISLHCIVSLDWTKCRTEREREHLRWIRVGHLFEALPFLISHQLFMLSVYVAVVFLHMLSHYSLWVDGVLASENWFLSPFICFYNEYSVCLHRNHLVLL